MSVANQPPDDFIAKPLITDRGSVKLQNSDVLHHLDKKLQHLPVGERESIARLVREFSDVFPDVPCKTTLACHDVDVGNARPSNNTLTGSILAN